MKALYFYAEGPMAHLVVAKADDLLQFHTIEDAPGHGTHVGYADISGNDIYELRDFLNEHFPRKIDF